MVLLLIILYLFIALCTYFEDFFQKQKVWVYFIIGILLVLIAGLRPPGCDNDSLNYQYLYESSGLQEDSIIVEPSFYWIGNLIKNTFDDFQGLLIIYAIIGVFFKMKAIQKLSPSVLFLPLLVYFCNYFILHEMTQIRVGISAGIFMFALKPLIQGKRWQYLGWVIIAIFFHYSAIILLPIVFINNKPIRKKEKWILLFFLPIGFIIAAMHINILFSIPIPAIQQKIQLYQELSDKGFGTKVNIFNIQFLIRVFVFFFSLLFYDFIKQCNTYIPIFIRLMAISIFSFLFLSSLAVLAFRVSELIGVVDIFVFSSLIYAITPKYAAKTIVIILTMLIMGLNLFYSPLILPV